SKLLSFSLMPSDIEAAIQAQNVQVSAGQIGQRPAPAGQQLNATVTAQSKMRTPQQFRDIIVKSDASGAIVHLGDVARVELGSESYDVESRFNGHPASGCQILLAPGANALAVAGRVKQVVDGLKPTMPPGWQVAFPFDSTKFIRQSIEEVVKTLFEAIALVVIVIFVFLQSWRATLVPVIAVPVVLLGTFCVLRILDYSINTLTLFGMVLSIGLLVDDAIVVVENVERLMRDEHLSPLDATIRSMKEITAALVGVATVLSAVFLPMAFFTGSTGIIYRQFSITIVASMLLSVFVALTVTPAMCASLLRASDHTGPRRGPFGWFNRAFDRMTHGYQRGVAGMLRRALLWLVPYLAIVGVMGLLLVKLPTGFLPPEDQGQAMVIWTLPSGATLPRTEEVSKVVEHHFLGSEAQNTGGMFTVAGFSFIGRGQNAGMALVDLADWRQRKGEANSAANIASRVSDELQSVRDAKVFALTPPAVDGLDELEGFAFE